MGGLVHQTIQLWLKNYPPKQFSRSDENHYHKRKLLSRDALILKFGLIVDNYFHVKRILQKNFNDLICLPSSYPRYIWRSL